MISSRGASTFVRGCAVVAGVALVVGVAGCSSDDDSTAYVSHKITLESRQADTDVGVVDLTDPGQNPGDIRVFSQHLFDKAGKSVGMLEGSQAITRVEEKNGVPFEYRAGTLQATLGKGTLVIAGVYAVPVGTVLPKQDDVIRPIVGGTGAYRGARGELTTHGTGDGVSDNIFDFETPKP